MGGAVNYGQTTRTEVAAAPQSIYDRQMLYRALDYLAYELYGQMKTLPKKSGEQVIFSRFDSLPLGVKLAEGTNPAAFKMAKTTATGTLATYGGYVEISEEVQMLTQDKVLLEAAELNGEAMGQTLDTVCRDIICAGTSVVLAGDQARSAQKTFPLKADLDEMILGLKVNKAKMFAPILKASPGVGTVPIRDSFFAITSFESTEYFESILAGGTKGKYIPVAEYGSMDGIQKNEQGSYRNVRFIATNNAFTAQSGTSTTGRKQHPAGKNEIHTTLVLGRDAFGKTPIDGKGQENIVKPRSVVGGPLERFSTSGWKSLTGYLILVENFMYRYEYAVPA